MKKYIYINALILIGLMMAVGCSEASTPTNPVAGGCGSVGPCEGMESQSTCEGNVCRVCKWTPAGSTEMGTCAAADATSCSDYKSRSLCKSGQTGSESGAKLDCRWCVTPGVCLADDSNICPG